MERVNCCHLTPAFFFFFFFGLLSKTQLCVCRLATFPTRTDRNSHDASLGHLKFQLPQTHTLPSFLPPFPHPPSLLHLFVFSPLISPPPHSISDIFLFFMFSSLPLFHLLVFLFLLSSFSLLSIITSSPFLLFISSLSTSSFCHLFLLFFSTSSFSPPSSPLDSSPISPPNFSFCFSPSFHSLLLFLDPFLLSPPLSVPLLLFIHRLLIRR